MSERARRAVLALALVLVPLLLCGRALLPGRLFLPQHPAMLEPLASEDPARAARAAERANLLASDALFPAVTDLRAMRRALAAGALPTWDPDAGLGMPLAAQSIVSPWYPLRWLELAGGERMRAVHAIASLVLAGLGMALFLRARGHSAAAVAVGALAHQSSAFALVNLHYGMKVDAALWLPWALWSVERVLAARPHARATLALVLGLACLAGFPPIALFVIAATACYAAVRVVGSAPTRARSSRGALVSLALALGAALAIGAVALVPMAEASALSLRGPRGAASLFAERLPAAATSTLLLPNLFGGPSDALFAPQNPLAWWFLEADESDRAMIANALEWNLHAGIAVLLLCFAGLVAAPRRALVPATAILLALGFAFGWPIVRLAYRLPGLDLGAPARAAAVAWTFWAVLAAVGVDALALARRRAIGTVLVFALGLALFGGSLAAAIRPETLAARMELAVAERHGRDVAEVRAWIAPDDGVRAAARLKTETRWLARFAALSLAAGALALVLARRAHERRRALVLALAWSAIVVAEGARLAREHLVPRDVPGELFPRSAAMDALRGAAADGRVVRLDGSASGVGDVLALARPNLPAGYGIADLTPYVVFPPRALVAAFRALDPASAHGPGFSRLSDAALLAHPLLDLARVTAVLSRTPLEHHSLTPVHQRAGFHAYRRECALGGAWVVPRVLHASAEEAAERVARADFALDAPWIAGRASESAASDPAPGAAWLPGTITLDHPAPHRLDAAVRGSSGGWLLFSAQHAPGWKATVNGEDVPVAAAYGFLRAVPIPPGDSVVRTKYEPASLRLGASLTLGGLAVLAWWTARGRRGTQSTERSAPPR